MSLEWESKSFSDLVDIIGGGTPKTSIDEYWNGDIPWISIKDFNSGQKYVLSTEKTITELGLNNSSTKLLHKDDIIISARGTVGEVAMIKYEMVFNQSCYGLKVHELLDKDFVYYLLGYNINKLRNMVHGAVFDTITTNTFDNIIVNVPPQEYQEKISYLLSNIDNLIEVKIHENKNLDDILDSIFKENFIKEFDNDNNDWKIKNIGELPLIITDYVANGSFASLKENVTILDYEEYAYFIRNTDLKSKSFQKFVNKHSYDFLKKSSLFGNEVIISNVGDVGSVFLCPFLDKPMTLGNNMILVKSRDDAINLNFYLFLLFRSNYGQYLISTITAGSVQSKFNKTEFKSLELTMPNDELIIKFNNLVSPIFDYKNKISDEIVRLTKLRDTLLPKLMSGEIDVSKINCDLKIIIRKIYIKSSKLFLWRYLSENKNYIKNTKSNETLLKSRTIYQINKFLAKFTTRYRYYRQ